MKDEENQHVTTVSEPEPTPAAKQNASDVVLQGFEALADVPARADILVGACFVPAGELLSLATGSILPLERKAGSDLLLYVNGARIASVRPVFSGSHVSFRITQLDLEESPEPAAAPATRKTGGG